MSCAVWAGHAFDGGAQRGEVVEGARPAFVHVLHPPRRRQVGRLLGPAGERREGAQTPRAGGGSLILALRREGRSYRSIAKQLNTLGEDLRVDGGDGAQSRKIRDDADGRDRRVTDGAMMWWGQRDH
jgi:hypothetical protein